MHDAKIAAVEPAAAERFLGRLRVKVVTGHHVVAAHDDLTHRAAVRRDVGHLGIHNAQAFGLDHVDALPGLQHGALLGGQVSPLRLRLAEGDRAICLGQPVHMYDAETHLFHPRDGGGLGARRPW